MQSVRYRTPVAHVVFSGKCCTQSLVGSPHGWWWAIAPRTSWPHGLPRRFASRNDDVGAASAAAPTEVDCHVATLLAMTGLQLRQSFYWRTKFCSPRTPQNPSLRAQRGNPCIRTSSPHGSPRRFAPRNDGVGAASAAAPTEVDCRVATLLAMTGLQLRQSFH